MTKDPAIEKRIADLEPKHSEEMNRLFQDWTDITGYNTYRTFVMEYGFVKVLRSQAHIKWCHRAWLLTRVFFVPIVLLFALVLMAVSIVVPRPLVMLYNILCLLAGVRMATPLEDFARKMAEWCLGPEPPYCVAPYQQEPRPPAPTPC